MYLVLVINLFNKEHRVPPIQQTFEARVKYRRESVGSKPCLKLQWISCKRQSKYFVLNI